MVLLHCRSFCCCRNSPPLEIGNTKPIRETGNHRLKETFDMFHSKRKPNLTIKPSSYSLLLQACAKERFLNGGLQVHAHMIKSGFESDQALQTSLLNLFVRCESIEFARRVFDTSDVRTSLISWNIMITMYCRFGLVEEALLMFLEMQRDGFEPDQYTFSVVIRALGRQKKLSLGRQFHSLSIKFGYGEEEFVGNSLIQMYATCGRMNDSIHVFVGLSEARSPVAWNLMIAQLVESGFYGDGLKLYKQMQSTGIEPTSLTFSSLLKACASVEAIAEGKQVHAQVIVRGFLPNIILESALVDLYIKFGELENGMQVFDNMEERNVITWNSIIRGYSQMGYREEALRLFGMMRRDFVPDKFTFPALLMGIGAGECVPEEFKAIHAYVIKVGLERDRFIGTSLLAMYSTNRTLNDAQLVFDDMDSVDIGAWSSMISVSVKNGEGEEVLQLFNEMLHLDIEPNQFIYSSLFMACGDLSTLEMGKQIHANSFKSSYPFDIATKNSLLTMYSNCGCISEARRIFDSIDNPSVISFNSMISALAQHGLPQEAAELFRRMKLIGLKPDEITLLNLLSAFNHAGLVNEGLELFNSIEEKQGIIPRYQHYACIVDMLARAGEIEDATRFIKDMPFRPDPSLWRIILGACGKHRNIETGRHVAEFLLELEPYEAANYVLIANIYARTDRWVEAERVRHLMEERGIEKEVAVSWIEIGRRTHTFGVKDQSHPLSEGIYEKLGELIREIKAVGYVPDISFALHNREDEKREESLFYHSEKLAFSFGILSTAEGFPIRIMKNLRVCGDCHSAYKYFSLITGREIVLRDNYRFHNFTGGKCSCGDYW